MSDCIYPVSVGMERFNGIPMEIFRLHRINTSKYFFNGNSQTRKFFTPLWSEVKQSIYTTQRTLTWAYIILIGFTSVLAAKKDNIFIYLKIHNYVQVWINIMHWLLVFV